MADESVTDETVFTARLDLLRQNLVLVGDVFGELDRRFAAAMTSGSADVDLSEQLRQVRRYFNDVRAGLKQQDVKAASTASNDLQKALNTLEEQATALEYVDSPVPGSDQLSNTLAAQGKTLLGRVDDLARSQRPIADRWSQLIELEADARDVFSEYVDLVRGAAMRSMELDGQLCRVADQLVAQVSNDWRSLTIPARRELQAASAAGIIRIGFPGWTIFSLPIAVHEYGHVVVEEMVGEGVLDLTALGADVIDESTVRSLLADVFAAQSAGPCYALALFTSRLDLRREAVLRPAVVLAALEDLVQDGGASKFVGLVGEHWSAVLAEIDPPPMPDYEVEPLIKAMKPVVYASKFPAGDWQGVIVPLAEQLRERAPDEVEVKPTADVRHVLNAGWLARIEAGDDYEHVERAAREVSLAMCSGRRRGGGRDAVPQQPWTGDTE